MTWTDLGPPMKYLACSALAFVFSVGALACSEARTEPSSAVQAVTPAPLSLAADRKDLVYRYVDASGQVGTAGRLEDIPGPSRRAVVVWDPQSPTPAGWDHVADLTSGLPATAIAQKDFAFATPAPAPVADNKSGGHEVVMFSTQGCGYCARARKFFKSKSVPYTELDLEADAGASAKLGTLGRKAGLSASDLQGVPIFFIDGKPVLGWDESALSKLLGLHG